MDELFTLRVFGEELGRAGGWRLVDWCRERGASEFTVVGIPDPGSPRPPFDAFDDYFNRLADPFRLAPAQRRQLGAPAGKELTRSTELWTLNDETVSALYKAFPRGIFNCEPRAGGWFEDLILYRRGELMLGIITQESEGVLRVAADELNMLHVIDYRLDDYWVWSQLKHHPLAGHQSPMTLRPTLSGSGIDARSYGESCFERDLARVLVEGDLGPQVSLGTFHPDPEYWHPQGRVFHSLADSCWFLCAFFAAQLADQATHFIVRRVEQNRAGTHGELLLTWMGVMEPAYLLLVLALYDPPVATTVLADGLRDLVSMEFDALRSHGSASQIVAAAAESLVTMPESLRPVFSSSGFEPDHRLVDVLRKAALGALLPYQRGTS